MTADDIRAVAGWLETRSSDREIAYRPARVLMQDFTGVPAVVDLAAMRDAMAALNGDPQKINPLAPVDLIIDHSVQVDYFARGDAFKKNVAKEYERNRERYAFLRWGQQGFERFRVVPPGTGICHQVNLEYLAQTVWTEKQGKGKDQTETAYPDTLVGTDSHTTMINGLSVLGWGVGGIEAEAAMLGQPISMVIPEVIGLRFSGKLRPGCTATDLVLTVTQMLRKRGVVGKFVEFFGHGLAEMPVEDRATIGNMSPEYGATCGFFPIDHETLKYLQGDGPQSRRALRWLRNTPKHRDCFTTANVKNRSSPTCLHLDLDTRRTESRGPAAAAGSGRAVARERRIRGQPEQCIQGGRSRPAGESRRDGCEHRPWRCRDRRDHVLHQHLESLRDAGRGPAGAQRRGTRAEGETLGEDVAGARQSGGDRLSARAPASTNR